jgi:3-oxoacyl-[acyl-carrier-protein] synthase II
MTMRRVVITGLGAVTPVGADVKTYWDAITHGRSGIATMTLVDPDPLPCKVAAECADFDGTDVLGAKLVRRLDRSAQIGLVAAHQAWADADLDGKVDKDMTGVAFATGIGGIGSLLWGERTRLERGPDRVSPFTVPMLMANATAGHVGMAFGLRGPNFCTATACAASNHALGLALQTIRMGDADAMVAGGTESAFVPVTITAFAQMTALSTKYNDRPTEASRPFDSGRDGFIVGEGAGALVLEERESALRRGARIYAELAGFGQSADAYHVTLPAEDGGGAALAMQRACKSAGIRPEQVGYINAHGTSTPPGDISETKAIKVAFGDHAKRLAVSSTKSMIGHLIGAAGAVEGIATVLALRDGLLPPTINLTDPDPACDLDYVPNTARKADVEYALSNGFGFGGHNAAIAFRRHPEG